MFSVPDNIYHFFPKSLKINSININVLNEILSLILFEYQEVSKNILKENYSETDNNCIILNFKSFNLIKIKLSKGFYDYTSEIYDDILHILNNCNLMEIKKMKHFLNELFQELEYLQKNQKHKFSALKKSKSLILKKNEEKNRMNHFRDSQVVNNESLINFEEKYILREKIKSLNFEGLSVILLFLQRWFNQGLSEKNEKWIIHIDNFNKKIFNQIIRLNLYYYRIFEFRELLK